MKDFHKRKMGDKGLNLFKFFVSQDLLQVRISKNIYQKTDVFKMFVVA